MLDKTQVKNKGLPFYQGFDDETGEIIKIKQGEIKEVSKEKAEQLLSDYNESFEIYEETGFKDKKAKKTKKKGKSNEE